MWGCSRKRQITNIGIYGVRIGIYKIESITNPDRYYIGSSVNIHKRWLTHKLDLKNNKHHSIFMQHHYNKYGEEDIIYTIIEECNKENLLNREQYYIDILSPAFNICKIAGNCLGKKHTDHSKHMMSISRIGKPAWNRGLKSDIVPWNKGKKMAETQRLSLIGHVVSEETKEKIRQSKTGIKQSENTIKKRSISLHVPVIQYTMDDIKVREYNSIGDAAASTGYSRSHISDCCRGVMKMYKQYKWKYKNK